VSYPFAPLMAADRLTLDPGVVEDDESLAERVDEFIATDSEAGARLREIAGERECLRHAVDEMIVERWPAQLSLAAFRIPLD
jgi:hypothetical protein